MTAQRRPADYITVEEYLIGEIESEARHEYFAGQVFEMAGGSSRHNVASLYLASRIDQQLEGKPCQVFMSDMKIRVEFMSDDVFYYPDVFVACDPDDNKGLYLYKPKFWLEVVSDTEKVT